MKQEKDQSSVYYDRHTIEDPQDWRRSFKEAILALKGMRVEFWDDVLEDANWWATFGRADGGVDNEGKPVPTKPVPTKTK